MKHVLIVSSHFPPDRGPGTHRLVRFAKHLAAAGWRVSVLTMDPAYYPSGTQVDPGLVRDVPDEVRVYRTKVTRGLTALIRLRNRVATAIGDQPRGRPTTEVSVRRSVRQQVKDLVTDLFAIPDRDIGWFWHATRAASAVVRREPVDVLLSSGPPFTCHVIAAALKRRFNVPWTADFRDPWARSPWAVRRRHGRWKRRIQQWLEGRVVRLADAVVLNTEPMRAEFARHYGPSASEKFHTVTNGYDADVLAPFVGRRMPASRSTVSLTHAGTLYKQRDPRPLLRAVAAVTLEGEVPPEGLHLHLVGGVAATFGVPALVRDLGIESSVTLTPPVSHRESLTALAKADVLVVLQPGTDLQVPAKLYEYMAFEKPMLVLADRGALADIVETGRLGVVVAPSDQRAIERALLDLYRNRDRLADMFPVDRAYVEAYDGRQLARRMEAILRGSLGERANGTGR